MKYVCVLRHGSWGLSESCWGKWPRQWAALWKKNPKGDVYTKASKETCMNKKWKFNKSIIIVIITTTTTVVAANTFWALILCTKHCAKHFTHVPPVTLAVQGCGFYHYFSSLTEQGPVITSLLIQAMSLPEGTRPVGGWAKAEPAKTQPPHGITFLWT